MDPLDFRSIHLDDCPQCGGIWFDDGELKKIQSMGDELAIQSLEAAATPAPDTVMQEVERKLCPVCNERLVPYHYMYSSNIELDQCDNFYGVWVQECELQKMDEYSRIEVKKLDPSKREVIAAVAADATMAMRSKKSRGKSLVAFWSVFGHSRAGRAQ